ncbi:N-acetylneuraminate synthase family protein [Colwellia sp. 4_MG-2023]|uniref:N-acetylneuraminate synthase family protein n=1 Tax=unclassified Colwellia TaxID=196834 RepID=UPI0026E3DB6F|nr:MULTISPECIES: N-acetylneuraminate synthase family protein [unclassified Colwellia]MDO6507254.1 N-acetylneuraminate synthase family protein [Colwellia sp. 5_MG-2023]MDO6555402.1 N-acetylneuraminate synthase family protein [Colwellia sp. 4_MG-2023]
MKVKIGNQLVGDDNPTFIIAEVGSNHNQDYALALAHIDAAAKSGVDAVKFQTFRADKHVSKFAEMPEYLTDYDNIHDLIKTLELERDWQKPLKEYAESKGLQFFSSPCDYEAVDSLEALNVPAHKIASFDLPDLDLVRYIAKTGKPVLLSTGMADWMEIQRAVDVCREEGNEQIILFQCTSLYPAPTKLSNLKSMKKMRDMFNVVVGYSDHTLGDLIPIASVAMGSAIIEKHFTLDRSLPGPDHSFAMEPEELAVMVNKIREVETAIGDGSKKGPREEELDMYDKVRRSLHVTVNVQAGDIITEDMLTTKRPGFGIEPYRKSEIIGAKARVDIAKDHWIDWSMI